MNPNFVCMCLCGCVEGGGGGVQTLKFARYQHNLNRPLLELKMLIKLEIVTPISVYSILHMNQVFNLKLR